MSVLIAANNASTTLAQSISSSTTTITLATGTGSVFPSPTGNQAFKLSLTDASTRLQHEVTLCTSRSGDVCTVLRGQEGTTAQSWSAGDIVANLPTAGTMQNAVQIDQLQQNYYQFGVGTVVNDTYTSSITTDLTSLNDGMIVYMRSPQTNQTNNVFFILVMNGVSVGPLPIIKGTNVGLATGDMPGTNADAQLMYNSSYSAWTLMNPTTSPVSTTVTQPTGSVIMWTNTTPPLGWLLCNGQAVSRISYSGLFAIIGLSFGSGDGVNTFNLPNYQNMMPIGAGAAYGLAATGGSVTSTLVTANIPSHNHSAVSTSTSSSSSLSNSTANSNSVSTSNPTGTATSVSTATPTGTAVSTSTSSTTGTAVSTSTSITSGTASSSSVSTFTGNALPTHTHSAVDSGHQHSYVSYASFAPQTGSSTPCWYQTSSQKTGIGYANVTIGTTSAGTPSGSVSTTTSTALLGLSTTTNTNTALSLSTTTNTATSLSLSTPVTTNTTLTLDVPVATTTTTSVNTTTATTTGTVTTTSIGNTGSGTAFTTISPYLAIYFIIRT
jgi:microcystin-dependent protein